VARPQVVDCQLPAARGACRRTRGRCAAEAIGARLLTATRVERPYLRQHLAEYRRKLVAAEAEGALDAARAARARARQERSAARPARGRARLSTGRLGRRNRGLAQRLGEPPINPRGQAGVRDRRGGRGPLPPLP
jgi:hypothetical protein